MITCTVAIPVYNRQDMIQKALESVLVQDVPDLEILVVDNCSTDQTWEVLQTYPDPRLRLVRNAHNLGLFGNFNRCLELSQGTYIRFLCSDDRLAPNCLTHEIAVMERYPTVSLLSTHGQRIDETGSLLGLQSNHFPPGIYHSPEAIHAILWFQAHYAYNPLNYPSGVLLRRNAAMKAGRFDETMRMSGDVDFFLRVLAHGDLAIVDAVGCKITIHANQEAGLLGSNIAAMREIFLLTERYRTLLEENGTYVRIQEQLTAYALGLAYKYWRSGAAESSRLHYELARSNQADPLGIATAVMRLLFLRFLLKLTGFRSIPANAMPFSVE